MGTNSPGGSQHSLEPQQWLRLLPRWSLTIGLVGLGFLITFVVFVGPPDSDSALGARYQELFQAVRAPAAYRVQMVLDAFLWLLTGGLLFVFAGVLRYRAPVRSAFIGALGIAQLTGVIGALLRANGIGELASQYATATADQQALLLQSYLSIERVITSLFQAGNLLRGPGFLLVAWVAYSLAGFPRWLAFWLALAGLLDVAQFVAVATGAVLPTNPPPIVLAIVVVSFPLVFAMAAALWRPAPALVSAISRQVAERE